MQWDHPCKVVMYRDKFDATRLSIELVEFHSKRSTESWQPYCIQDGGLTVLLSKANTQINVVWMEVSAFIGIFSFQICTSNFLCNKCNMSQQTELPLFETIKPLELVSSWQRKFINHIFQVNHFTLSIFSQLLHWVCSEIKLYWYKDIYSIPCNFSQNKPFPFLLVLRIFTFMTPLSSLAYNEKHQYQLYTCHSVFHDETPKTVSS